MITSVLCAIILYVAVNSVINASSFAQRSDGTDWQMAILSACLDATIAVWFASFGACIGSFLNVVAYRLPKKMGIIGDSKCPSCGSKIDGADNVPVLGWLRLRGRCRACSLPIAAQYPLVEFAAAVVFLAVYFVEFSTCSANLPVEHFSVRKSGVLRYVVTYEGIVRICTYLFALSGLMGAALIAVRNQRVPLGLYAWSIAPWVIAAFVMPDAVPVHWKELTVTLSPRLHALTTVLCGAAAALGAARCLAPILYPGFDRSLLASDSATRKCRQFLGASVVLGALFGWQASLAALITVLVIATLGAVAFRRYKACYLDDLTVWMWAGIFLYRCLWQASVDWRLVSVAAPPVMWVVLAMGVAVALAAIYRRTVVFTNAGRVNQEDRPQFADQA